MARRGDKLLRETVARHAQKNGMRRNKDAPAQSFHADQTLRPLFFSKNFAPENRPGRSRTGSSCPFPAHPCVCVCVCVCVHGRASAGKPKGKPSTRGKGKGCSTQEMLSRRGAPYPIAATPAAPVFFQVFDHFVNLCEVLLWAPKENACKANRSGLTCCALGRGHSLHMIIATFSERALE